MALSNAARWYTIVTEGTACTVPRGPWRSTDEAYGAVERWSAQRGHLAATELKAATARIVGPFASRDLARAADISDRTSPIVATL